MVFCGGMAASRVAIGVRVARSTVETLPKIHLAPDTVWIGGCLGQDASPPSTRTVAMGRPPRRLVGAIAEHPSESQRDAARVAGAALDSVEGDLDNEVRLDPYQPVVLLDGSGEELLGLPGQELVGQTFEGLAEHDELARAGIASAEVEVGQPASAATVAPLGGRSEEGRGGEGGR